MPLSVGNLASFSALSLVWLTSTATAEKLPVDLELVLAVDVSASMDRDEQRLQREGYVAAFRSPRVLQAIRSGPYGRIAVAYVEWGGPRSQDLVVPWELIDGDASAASVSRLLVQRPINHFTTTSISAALRFSVDLLDANGFASERQVIDISGDGPNDAGPPVAPARDAVIAEGVTVNGLPIMIHLASDNGQYSIEGLDLYYEDCVVGGPGAFVVAITALDQFAAAIERKLIMEIAGRLDVPTPITEMQRRFRIDCLSGENSPTHLLPLIPGRVQSH